MVTQEVKEQLKKAINQLLQHFDLHGGSNGGYGPLNYLPIELWDSQVESVNKIQEILGRSYGFVDTSGTGAGKTIKLLYTYQLRGGNLFVVCPRALMGTWEESCKCYGLHEPTTTTYEGLATGKNQWLRNVNGNYYPTEKLLELIRAGTIFVFDEFHKIKNSDTLNAKAAFAIARAVKQNPGPSRVALLSATGMEKPSGILSTCAMLGLVNTPEWYAELGNGYHRPTGIHEFAQTLEGYAPGAARSISYNNSKQRDNDEMVMKLFVEHLKPLLMTASPKPNIPYRCDLRDAYYTLTEEENQWIAEAISKLRRAGGGDEEAKGFIDWSLVTEACWSLERAKIRIMAEQAKEKLRTVPGSKVIMFTEYLDNQLLLAQYMAEYYPLGLNGDTDTATLNRVRLAFQASSLEHGHCRVLLSSLRVGGVGLSLDDIVGNEPRFVFMVPSYKFIDLHQACGRAYRGTTKSDVMVHMVYSMIEATAGTSSIFNNLARKKDMVKEFNVETEERTLYPGEYPIFIHGHGNFEMTTGQWLAQQAEQQQQAVLQAQAEMRAMQQQQGMIQQYQPGMLQQGMQQQGQPVLQQPQHETLPNHLVNMPQQQVVHVNAVAQAEFQQQVQALVQQQQPSLMPHQMVPADQITLL